jgi:predicted Zn-dependent peptidase
LGDANLFTHTFDNGLTLAGEQLSHSRAAAFQLLLPAGAVTDPDDKLGSATALEDLSLRGAGSRNIRELSDALDALGLQRGGGADLEYSTYSGSLMADDLAEALALHADIVLRPHLPEDQVPTSQTVALHRIEALEDRPSQKLFIHLQEAYFPGPHGRSSMGTPEGIKSLTVSDLRADHERRYRPQGAILGVAGKFDRPQLIATVEKLFGEWNGSAPPLPKPSSEGRRRYVHLPKETSQVQIGVAYGEVDPNHPDFYNSLMAVQILSSGFASRLFTEVREKRGLCYSVFASNRAVKDAGFIMAYAGTTPERSQETLDVLLAELQRLPEGVTDDEVLRARTGLLSSLVMQGESTGARVSSITRDYFLRGRLRTLDEIRVDIEKVTPETIKAHLQANPPKDFTVVTLGPTELKVNA